MNHSAYLTDSHLAALSSVIGTSPNLAFQAKSGYNGH